ncbi:MAG: shikimate kinase [Anaerolineales bacterium]
MKDNKTIILIGPMCAGKSTVAELLAKKLAIPHYAVDDHRWDLYEQTDYSKEVAAQIMKSDQGTLGLLQYMKPFEVYAVERILAEQSNCVIDFGAGHSVHEDPQLFARVEKAMAPFDNVILLLPSEDVDQSVKILNERFEQLLQREVGEVDPKLLGLNDHFTKHPSNFRLAKHIVYTDGKTAEETCDEIIEAVTFGQCPVQSV